MTQDELMDVNPPSGEEPDSQLSEVITEPEPRLAVNRPSQASSPVVERSPSPLRTRSRRSTAHGQAQAHPQTQTSSPSPDFAIPIVLEPNTTLVMGEDGRMVLEVLDTPKTRRERYMQRKKGSKADKPNAAGSSSRAGPSSVRSPGPVAGPSHLRVSTLAARDPEIESELSALSDSEDEVEDQRVEVKGAGPVEGPAPGEEFEQVTAFEPAEEPKAVVEPDMVESAIAEEPDPSEGHGPTVVPEPSEELMMDGEPAPLEAHTSIEGPVGVEPEAETEREEDAEPKPEDDDVDTIPQEETKRKGRSRRTSGKRSKKGKGKGKGRENGQEAEDAEAGEGQRTKDGIIKLDEGKYLDGGTLGTFTAICYIRCIRDAERHIFYL